MAEVTAQLNNLRMSPRKVRMVADVMRGKNAVEALAQLDHFVQRPAPPLAKALRSAIANAENNAHMVRDNLYVKKITVDGGMILKRFKAKGFGRAMSIQKKTSRVTIVLDERVAGLRRQAAAKVRQDVTAAPHEHVHEHEHDHNHEHAPTVGEEQGFGKQPVAQRTLGKEKNILARIGKRMFRRKVV